MCVCVCVCVCSVCLCVCMRACMRACVCVYVFFPSSTVVLQHFHAARNSLFHLHQSMRAHTNTRRHITRVPFLAPSDSKDVTDKSLHTTDQLTRPENTPYSGACTPIENANRDRRWLASNTIKDLDSLLSRYIHYVPPFFFPPLPFIFCFFCFLLFVLVVGGSR